MKKPFSLSKQERLKSQKDIDTLFQSGKAFFIFPYRVCYHLSSSKETAAPLQFGISVPKRNFKRSVDRNLIKRLSRETYRVQKNELLLMLTTRNQSLKMMWIYMHKEKLSHAELYPSVSLILQRLSEILAEQPLP